MEGARRQELLGALDRARSQRERGAGATPSPGPRNGTEWVPSPALPPGTLDRDKVRATVREAVPLLFDCYQRELDEKPDFAGRLELVFTVAGEPDVGGLVEDVALESPNGMTERPAFAECVRETMLSLEFEPPEAGGKVVIRYPFEFSHD
jgi:hypothetical protein